MAAGGTGPCGLPNCPSPPCGGGFGGAVRCPMQPQPPLHAGRRRGHLRRLPGSRRRLRRHDRRRRPRSTSPPPNSSPPTTPTRASTSTCGPKRRPNSLTLVSKGNNPAIGEPGTATPAAGSFTADEVRRRDHLLRHAPTASLPGGAGGNCRSDNSIASESGDIYFFSPEQLDGSRGIPNQENLYVYRDGQLQYVTTLTRRSVTATKARSGLSDQACCDSADRQDAGHARRQPHGVRDRTARSPSTTTPATSRCTPTTPRPARSSASPASPAARRRPPTSTASQDGLFLTNDGRAFFTTERRARPRRHQQGAGRLRVRRRPAAADHPGHGRDARRQAASCSALLNPPGPGRGQRRRPRRLLLDLRHAGPPGPQRPLPQVLRRPHRRRLPGARPAAALRRGRRVPRRRQLAAGRDRRTEPAPRSAAATLATAQAQASASAKRQRRRARRRASAASPSRHGPAEGAMSAAQLDRVAACSRCWRRAAVGAGPAGLRRGERADHRRTRPCRRPTQAGGHPDVEVQFAVENRVAAAQPEPLQLRGRQRRHRPPARRASSATRTRRRSARSPSSPPTTARSTRRSGSSTCVATTGIRVQRRGLQPRSAARRRRPARLQDLPLRHAAVHGAERPHRQRLRPRRDGDLDLPRLASRSRRFRQVLWGVPADPSHDALRLDTRPTPQVDGPSVHVGQTLRRRRAAQHQRSEHGRQAVRHRTSGLAPSLEQPAHARSSRTRPPATARSAPRSTSSPTTAASTTPTTRGRSMTGCDQLSFNPSLYAQPTTSETDSASGIDVNLTVPQQLSPTIPSPTELRGATVTLPPGFSINPNAADGKTACSDAEANFGTDAAQPTARSSPRSAASTIDSSALPGPLPGFVYLGEPLPGNRYRIFLVADGFATHVKLAGHGHPRPADRPARRSPSTNLPQSPLTAFNMHFFGSERGPARDADPVRHLPGHEHLHALGLEPRRRRPRPSSSRSTPGPDGAPCPGATRPFAPSFQAASPSNTAGAHAPSRSNSTRADGDQNLAGLTVTTPPGLLRHPRRRSLLLRGGARPRCRLRLLRASPSWPSPSCPAASQIGTAIAGAGAGTHPLYVAGQGLPRRPLQGRPAQPRRRSPRRSPVPMTSATSSSGPRSTSIPTTPRSPRSPIPLPQILEGIPLRLRSIRVNLDRPNFALNPTNCDPFAVERRRSPATKGAAGRPQQPLPGRQLRRPCPSARSSP